jgi:hypothetical protein
MNTNACKDIEKLEAGLNLFRSPPNPGVMSGPAALRRTCRSSRFLRRVIDAFLALAHCLPLSHLGIQEIISLHTAEGRRCQ